MQNRAAFAKSMQALKEGLETSMFVPERIEQWSDWCVMRESIRIKKEDLNQKPPYTDDQTMANTRWCNVRRMDDKVSKWLLDNWYGEYANSGNALIAALLARMINRPATLSAITGGKPFKKFDYDRAYEAMYAVKNAGGVVFTNAYIINGASGGPKIDQVLNAIRDCHEATASRFIVPASMQLTAAKISTLRGVGSFISGQVVADLRHVLGGDEWWQDRMTWAPPGPGSSRGMKYLLGLASAEDMNGRGSDLKEKQFLPALRALVLLAQKHKRVGPIFRERKLEAHDIQNTLCETSKYIRIKFGGGRGKNGYNAMGNYYEQMDI